MQGRDLKRIKWHARALSRNAELSYMQALDQAARDLFGVRHFDEAQARTRAATGGALQTGGPSSGREAPRASPQRDDRGRRFAYLRQCTGYFFEM